MTNTISDTDIMDCACLIHNIGYDWIYVQRLYDMLCSNSHRKIRLHVYTEPERTVPAPMIKHDLTDWPGVGGRKRSWWYKMQIFNPQHHRGPLLYFDLDVVLTKNIDWIYDQDTSYFWTVHDFRHLWRTSWNGMNSSVMFWDTGAWANVWEGFQAADLGELMKRYQGDQDYLNQVISPEKRRFLDSKKIKSWRWQIKDGGLNVRTQTYARPGTGSSIDRDTCVIVFHGDPKPHQINDPLIEKFWGNL